MHVLDKKCFHINPAHSICVLSAVLSPWAVKLYAKMSREEMRKLTDKQKKKNKKMVNKTIKKDGTLNVLGFLMYSARKFDGDIHPK